MVGQGPRTRNPYLLQDRGRVRGHQIWVFFPNAGQPIKSRQVHKLPRPTWSNETSRTQSVHLCQNLTPLRSVSISRAHLMDHYFPSSHRLNNPKVKHEVQGSELIVHYRYRRLETQVLRVKLQRIACVLHCPFLIKLSCCGKTSVNRDLDTAHLKSRFAF